MDVLPPDPERGRPDGHVVDPRRREQRRDRYEVPVDRRLEVIELGEIL
jgi:hypothetical protein